MPLVKKPASSLTRAELDERLRGVSGDTSIYDIINLRHDLAGNKMAQAILGPMDHQAFARELILDSEGGDVAALRALGLAVAIPGYEAGKALGLVKDDGVMTSPASWQSVKSGYRGLAQGLQGWRKKGRADE